MEQYITYKKLIDKLEEFADRHPNINSFGFGNLVEFGKDVENTTPLYPLLFVVPQTVTYDEAVSQYGVQIFLADKLNDDQEGSVSIVSEMSLISKDLLGTFKLNEEFRYLADFDFPVTASPFLERFNDVLAGVSMTVNFNVSDYLDICQLNPIISNKLLIDFTNTPNYGGFKPYGYLRVVINGTTELELDGSGNTGNYEVLFNTGDVIELVNIYPQTPVVGVGYGVVDITMGAETIHSETCSIVDNFTITGDNTDYQLTYTYDADCASNYDVNIYTKDGLWTGDTPGLEGRIITTNPANDQTFGIQSGSTFVLYGSVDVGFGTDAVVSISDRLSGSSYQRTSIIVEKNGSQVYSASCGTPLSYTISATDPDDVFDVYLFGDETCPLIPTPTPTPTSSNTPTPTPTPSITPTSSITPTPTITPSSTLTPTPTPTITPSPTPITYNILTEGGDTITTEGDDPIRTEQN